MLTTNFSTDWLIKFDTFFAKLGAKTAIYEDVGCGVDDEKKLTQAKNKKHSGYSIHSYNLESEMCPTPVKQQVVILNRLMPFKTIYRCLIYIIC